MISEADIDIVVDSLIQNNQVKEKLWSQMFSHPSQDEQLNIILDSEFGLEAILCTACT